MSTLPSFRGNGRFEILGPLGRGGMGAVYHAFDRERRAHVALKTVGIVTGEALLRFKREFRAVQDIDHPNLVHLGELFEEGGHWFFTMELVDGEDFLSYVTRRRAREDMPTEELTTALRAPRSVLALAEPSSTTTDAVAEGFDESILRPALAQLVSGLRSLHSIDKVHRDIKPSNVLVTKAGRVVILDFGLVTSLAEGVQATDVAPIGTISYMAPEQAAGRPIDARADWYAVGVLLYEALTGRKPYDGEGIQVLFRQQQEDARAPSAFVAGLPPDLDALCTELLRRDPAERPSGEDIERRVGLVATASPRTSSVDGTAFVGRAAQIEALLLQFERVRRGERAVVSIVGPQGMGKSALAERFAEQLRARSPEAAILTGRCHELELVPYNALDGLVDDLSRHLKRLVRAEREAVLLPEVAFVSRVFPVLERLEELAGKSAHLARIKDPLEQRSRFFEATRALFGRLARMAPLVCIIDDFHWTDEDSHRMLVELTRPPDPPAMMTILLLREGDEAAASPWLANAADGGLSDEVLRLGPLAEDEANELVSRLLPPGLPGREGLEKRIVAEANGHPLFIHALELHVRKERSISAVPDLDAALRTQVAALGGDERRLAEVLAVAGSPIAQRSAAEAAGIDAELAARRLNALRMARVVRTHGPRPGDAVELAHDRFRVAVLAELGPELVRTHHLALAEALDRYDGEPERIVRHWLGAGAVDRAAELAKIAAERAESAVAFARAAEFYRQALELGRPAGDARRELLVRLGGALANAGKGLEASDVFLEAVEGAERLEALSLQSRAGAELVRNGHFDRGLELLEGVLEELGHRVPRSAWAGIPRIVMHRLRAGSRRLDERPAAEKVSAEELVAIDAAYSIMSGLGSVQPIRSLYMQGMHLRGALRSGDTYRVARALVFETVNDGVAGTKDEARVHRRMNEVRERIGGSDDPRVRGILHLLEAATAFWMGRFKTCEEEAIHAMRFFREECVGMFWELTTAQSVWIEGLRSTGAWRTMRERAPRFVEEHKERGDRIAQGLWACAAPMFVHLLGDEPDRALREAEKGLAEWGTGPGFSTVHFGNLYFTPWQHAYKGDDEAAFRLLEAGFPTFRRSLLFYVQTLRYYGHEVRGLMALRAATGTTSVLREERLSIARRSAAALEREGSGAALAVARLLRGGIAAASGDQDGALASLDRAIALFRTAHMHGYLQSARWQMGRLVGGSAGAALVAEAKAFFEREAVVRPARVASLFTPGYPRLD